MSLFVDYFELANSRNRLSSRFINKGTTAKPIRGGEENLLQSRSKIKKIKHGKPKLATEVNETISSGIGAPRRRPQEGNNAQRRYRRDY
jgi:hypothetical protein